MECEEHQAIQDERPRPDLLTAFRLKNEGVAGENPPAIVRSLRIENSKELLQVCPQNLHDPVDLTIDISGDAPLCRCITAAECFPEVAFQDLCYQTVGRAAHGDDLLQQRATFGSGLYCTLQRFGLSPDTTKAGDGLTFLFWRVWHQIVLLGAGTYCTGDMFHSATGRSADPDLRFNVVGCPYCPGG